MPSPASAALGSPEQVGSAAGSPIPNQRRRLMRAYALVTLLLAVLGLPAGAAAQEPPPPPPPPPPILNILVPQTEHAPVVAGRPFFMVICFSPFISLFALHFTQYPTVANRRRSCALGYKNSSMHACFALFEHKMSPNLGKFMGQIEKSSSREEKRGQF